MTSRQPPQRVMLLGRRSREGAFLFIAVAGLYDLTSFLLASQMRYGSGA